MRNIAICGDQIRTMISAHDRVETVEIDGRPVHVGLLHAPDTAFDPAADSNRARVLVRIKAFSCNYRDKGWVMKMAMRGPADGCYVIGSDFVGRVVAKGADVSTLEVGDRVIPECSYPYADHAEVRPGVPTNHASNELTSFHHAKLMKIPPEVSDEVAAGFSIGAQTSYSMVRRLDLDPGQAVLVTAPRSNTALFTINALRRRGVKVYALASSPAFDDRLRALGVERVVTIDPAAPSFREQPEIAALIEETHGFDAVVDPLHDVHLPDILDLVAVEGAYITCGNIDQLAGLVAAGIRRDERDLDRALRHALLKNLTIMGNCLGRRADLEQALRDHAAGRFPVVLDSVHRGRAVGAFLTKTFVDKARFGKVVYAYDD